MNRVYAKLIAMLALVLILAPIIPAGTINIVRAQGGLPASIVGNSANATPGGPVWVAIRVDTGNTLVEVNLTAPDNTVWRSVQRVIVTPGTYNITLTLPKKLPGLMDPTFNIVVSVGGSTIASLPVDVIPIVEVTPSVTTNVVVSTATGGVGNATINVIGYGFPTYLGPVSYVNVSDASVSKVWDVSALGITPDSNGVINISGLSFGDLLDASTLAPSPYLPKGTYSVVITTDDSSINDIEEAGSLTINPIVAVTPSAGHGRWIDAIRIKGYGFDANAVLTSIEFVNQNFTGVKYVFTGVYDRVNDVTSKITVDSDGVFDVTTDPNADVHLIPETNMSAGMYYINVTWSSAGTYHDYKTNNIFLVNATTNLWEAKNLVSDGEAVAVNTTLHVNGTTEYVQIVQKTVNSYRVVGEFTFQGTLYYLVVNITGYGGSVANITFDLYNATATPMVLIDHKPVTNVPVDTTYEPDYFTAWYAFNLSGTFDSDAGANVSTAPSNSQFLAKYWGNYTLNVGNLYIYQRKFIMYTPGSELLITYNNTDTGVVKNIVITPSNSTVKLVIDNTTSTVYLSEPYKIVDGNYETDIYFNADLDLYSSTYNTTNLTITVYRGIIWQIFPTAAYIVRPYLEVINDTVIKPGDRVMIAAYGYAPGTYKGTTNIMSIMWDENLTLPVVWAEDNLSFSGNTVNVGKDGNLTFVVKLPQDAKFGAHYLRGKDTFKYEYTLMVVIGASSYWAKITGITTQWKVTAKHPDYGRVVATVCGLYTGSKYCDIKVLSGPKEETLGDIIQITLYGIKKSDITAVYFGNIEITDYNVVESNNVVNITFVVPTVPEGKYPLRVETTQTTVQVQYFYNGTLVRAEPEVVPKIIVVSLNDVHQIPILVGPGFVKVIGTGFPPGASVKTVTVNGTDALYPLNTQITNWYADSDGVLVAYGGLEPGLFIPALEPGVYEIGLALQTPTGSEISQPGTVYVVNNLSKVVTNDEFKSFANDVTATLNSISGSVSVLGSKLDSLVGQVSSLSSSVNGLAASISDVSSEVKDLKGAVSDLKSSISTVLSDTAAIKGDLATLKNMVSNIKLSVDLTPVTSKLDSISSQLSDVKSSLGKLSKLDELDTINSNVQSAINAANAAKSSADAAKSAAEAAGNAISNVKTELASKIDSSTYVLYVATIFALLAFIFGILSWATARKAAAS